jgi:hypothetical protein
MTLRERFEAKVDKTGDCHLWTASCFHNGHGQFQLNGRPEMAHRVAWFLATGEWPKQQVNHIRKCPNKNCVRFEHLYEGTQQQNIDDAVALGHMNGSGWRSELTHCKRGHEFTPANTYIRPNGRECRTCKAENAKKFPKESENA